MCEYRRALCKPPIVVVVEPGLIAADQSAQRAVRIHLQAQLYLAEAQDRIELRLALHREVTGLDAEHAILDATFENAVRARIGVDRVRGAWQHAAAGIESIAVSQAMYSLYGTTGRRTSYTA